MKQILFLLCVCCISFGCNNRDKSSTIVELPKATLVVPNELTRDILITPPLQFKKWKNHSLFFQPGMNHSILFYNMYNQSELFWGKMGNGPDDFFSPLCIYENENDSLIELFDMNLRKIVKYKCILQDGLVSLSGIDYKAVKTDSISLLGMHKMETGWYIGFAGLGCDDMFVLLDNEMKIKNSFGESPIELMPSQNYLSLYGWFTSYGSKLFFASQPTGYLCCYNVDKEGKVNKEWEKFLTQPEYDASSNKWKKENKRGTYDIQANSEYIFLAFSGCTYDEGTKLPQDVLVFTHSGKFVKRIKYDNGYMFGKIAIKGDSIYGIGNDCLTSLNWKDAI